ncbi:hypothetical protein WN944_004491 [Citrus x changshan-huyou]|uniref:Uncharacterized protein n=1 Tax=Citrus x changshan-huyou TaxID=2935761 RepID=A0AAP0M383_9ROSI
MEGKRDYEPHAVCFPFPGQSHIKAMLKLAKLLHHKGFHITFVNFEVIQKSFLDSTTGRGHNSSDGSRSFRFEILPDSLLFKGVNSFCENPFLELLDKLDNSSSNDNQPAESGTA